MTTTNDTEQPSRSTRILLPAIFMLIGIITLAFGVDQDNAIAFYAGLAVTLAGVMTGVVFVIIRERAEDG